jgi:hypothetical protein
MPTHSLYLTTDIPTTTPAIPNISCLGADTSIVMTFSANSDGGSPITSYQYSTDNFIADINTIGIDSSPYTINNLIDGNTYNIELRAVNKNGVGLKTNSPDITPGNIASKPTINDISVGNASAIISFTTPSDTGGSIINYYILTYSNDDFVNSTTISNITTNPFTIESGLINGTTYKFKIRANNNFGDGFFSDDYTKAMPTIPSAPTINSITTPTNTTAIINFTAGSDGGLPITNYQYSTNAGESFTPFFPIDTTTPCEITGLTPGQPYNIQLRAVNSINPGTASASYPIAMPNIELPVVTTDLKAYFSLNETKLESISNTSSSSATSVTYATYGSRKGIVCDGLQYSATATSFIQNFKNINTFILTATNGVSISLWVYPTNITTTNSMLVSFAIDDTTSVWNGGGFMIHLTSSSINVVYSNYLIGNAGYSGNTIKTGLAISNNTWYHIVGIYNGSSGGKIYLNRTEQTTPNLISNSNIGSGSTGYSALNIFTPNNILSIGTSNTKSAASGYKETGFINFAGVISKVGIYNKILTSTEVTSLYNAG